MARWRELRSDRGQSLLVFLIILPVLILFAGVVIDGGNAFAQKRKVQSAADASALAAAQDIPLCPANDATCDTFAARSAIQASAEQYSLQNGGTGSLPVCADRDASGYPLVGTEDNNCYTWPWKGSYGRVEVKLQNSVDGFFTPFAGLALDFFRPAARAVAGVAGETHCYIGNPPVQRDDLLADCKFSDEQGTTTPPDTSDHCYVGDPPVQRDDLLPTCGLPDLQGTVVVTDGEPHCYIGDPPVLRDDLLPDCVLPGQSGSISGPTEPHCMFDPPVDNPDQYLNTTPPCSKAGFTEGGNPAIAFAHCGYPGDPCTGTSSECTAMHISGSNNHFYGAIVSGGGVQESGGNYGALPDGNALLYYGSQIDTSKCLTYKPTWAGPPTAQPPRDWPVPLPLLTCSNGSTGTSCSSGTWVTAVNGVTCKKLPTDKYTVNSNTQPAAFGGGPWSGLYCATVSITINVSGGVNALNAGFVAPSIGFSSGSGHLTGYTGLYSQYGGLLFDAYRGDINWSGSNNQWTGAVFAPLGNAQISGGGSQGTCAGQQASSCGFVEASTLQLSGSGGTWQGTGPVFGGVDHPPKIGSLVPGENAHCYVGNPPEQRDDLLPDCKLPDETGTITPADHTTHCYIGDPVVQMDDLLPDCKLPGETGTITHGDGLEHCYIGNPPVQRDDLLPDCKLAGETGTIVSTAGELTMDE